jgi:choline dehydrogenase-like flavoprotein
VRPRVIIVGAGPAAAGAALACVRHGDVDVTVLDVGGRLEPVNEASRARLAERDPADWAPSDLELISRLPEETPLKGLPEKRSFGSNFPFKDLGQRDRLEAFDGVNDALVSGAYGGFSNVWGAQAMPFSAATLDRWPAGSAAMAEHYTEVLNEIPFSGEQDDLAELFPLYGAADPLPPVAERTQTVLDRYTRARGALRRRGILLGRARLALRGSACVRAGLCMTGCPWHYVYSASQTFERLRARGQVDYRGGYIGVRLEERDGEATVVAKEVATGRLERFTGDRVLVACGAIGSSRLVAGSLGLDRPLKVLESAQFTLPFLSRSPTADPLTAKDFTLNQFNMVLKLDGPGRDLSQIHFYTYNPAFLNALPGPLKHPSMRWARDMLLRRLTVGIGYLPSWASPSFELRVGVPSAPDELPPATLHSANEGYARNPMLHDVLRRLGRAAPALDLWPMVPAIRWAASGKSYHVGGTFPHQDRPAGQTASDPLGRVAPWRRIHMVDASVFPDVPATTFTVTIMANAHRIASETLRAGA